MENLQIFIFRDILVSHRIRWYWTYELSSLRIKFRIYGKKINNFEASNADESWVMNIMIHNFECPLWADKGEAPLLEIADDS